MSYVIPGYASRVGRVFGCAIPRKSNPIRIPIPNIYIIALLIQVRYGQIWNLPGTFRFIPNTSRSAKPTGNIHKTTHRFQYLTPSYGKTSHCAFRQSIGVATYLDTGPISPSGNADFPPFYFCLTYRKNGYLNATLRARGSIVHLALFYCAELAPVLDRHPSAPEIYLYNRHVS